MGWCVQKRMCYTQYTNCDVLIDLRTYAYNSRVRVPPSICSTHCCHPPSCKPWVTSEDYLSSLSCALIWINRAISRDSGIATVDQINEEYIINPCPSQPTQLHYTSHASNNDLMPHMQLYSSLLFIYAQVFSQLRVLCIINIV